MSLSTKNPKTYEELAAIPVPETSGWHKPVAYKDHIDMVLDTYQQMYQMEPIKMSFGTNKEGTQMFGSIEFLFEDNLEYSYTHVLRNSYNKSLSIQNGGGGNVFVCDNLMMVADAILTARKNTLYAFEDVRMQIRSVAAAARENLWHLNKDVRRMKDKPCTEIEGYRLIGEMLGRKVISSTVANVAINDWRKPRHEEFIYHNLWSLYNCVTEGLKLVSGTNRMTQQTGSHKFFQEIA